MIRRYLYFVLLFSGILMTGASGQYSQTLYYMNLPQNHLQNPAMRSSNRVYVGLPGLSGVNIKVNNNFINFSDVFMKDQSTDSIITFLHPDYDIDKFISKLRDKNSVSPQVSVPLLGIGFSVGERNYFFLDITERVEGNVVIPGDLIKLMLKGNEQFVGDEMDLSSFRCDVKYYREVGFGLSRSYDKLRVGVKGKLLFGIAAVATDNNALSIKVNDDYTHTLTADLGMNLSGPWIVKTDENDNISSIDFDDDRFDSGQSAKKFFLGTQNFGLGLDIGATYDITDKLTVSASVTDFGYIRWSADVTNLRADNEFKFSGLSMVDVLKGDKTFDEVGDEMLDSLKNAFKVSRSSDSFNTWLPMGITFGGSYKLTKSISVGALSYSRIIGKQIRESLTLSANVNLGNAFSTSLGYTLENHRADNLGAGLAFRAGFTQFFMVVDRIPLTWNKITGDPSIMLPANWNTINLRLGMNLVFGNKPKKQAPVPVQVAPKQETNTPM